MAMTDCRLLNQPPATATPSCPDLTFQVGNYDISYRAGCLRRARRTDAIPDGWYNRVRIEDGQIVEVENDQTRTTLLPDLCSTPDDGVGYEAAPIGCNLTVVANNQIMTRLSTANVEGRGVWLEGCGSDNQPLVVNIDSNSLRSDMGIVPGGTVEGCGFSFFNGIMQSFPGRIITGVINNAPSVLNVEIDENCNLVISVPGVAPDGSMDRPSYESMRTCPNGMAGLYVGVFQSSGRFYVRTISSFSNDGQAVGNLIPATAPFYQTLEAAVAYVNSTTVACGGGDTGGA